MTQHKLGLSGSTILSDPTQFSKLFNRPKIDHIEIGEFPDEKAFALFLFYIYSMIHLLACIHHFIEIKASMIYSKKFKWILRKPGRILKKKWCL